MTAPRHLWSGDWRRESAEAAQQLREQRGDAEPPVEPATVEASRPRASRLDPLRAVLRSIDLGRVRIPKSARDGRRVRQAVLLGLAMLLAAGAAFGAVLALRTSNTPASRSRHSSFALNRRAAWLGVDVASFAPGSGAMIVDVDPGSPADRAGLEPGEVITAIDNQSVQSGGDVDSVLAGLHPGQRVQIDYQLGPLTYTTQLTLGSR
jgi:PDZ domain